MKRNLMNDYASPDMEIISVPENEGIVCLSELKGGDTIKDWTDGGSEEEQLYM